MAGTIIQVGDPAISGISAAMTGFANALAAAHTGEINQTRQKLYEAQTGTEELEQQKRQHDLMISKQLYDAAQNGTMTLDQANMLLQTRSGARPLEITSDIGGNPLNKYKSYANQDPNALTHLLPTGEASMAAAAKSRADQLATEQETAARAGIHQNPTLAQWVSAGQPAKDYPGPEGTGPQYDVGIPDLLALRKSYNQDQETYGKTVTAANRLQTSYEEFRKGNKTAAYSAVIQFVKALDPNSTVREGEVEMATQYAGIQSQVNSIIAMLQGESAMDPALMEDMLKNVYAQVETMAPAAEARHKQLTAFAGRHNLPMGDLQVPETWTPFQPRVQFEAEAENMAQTLGVGVDDELTPEQEALVREYRDKMRALQ